MWPSARKGARDAEARVLPLDPLKLLPEWLVVTRVRLVAGAGTRDFRQAAGFALREAALNRLRDNRAPLGQRVGGPGYFFAGSS